MLPHRLDEGSLENIMGAMARPHIAGEEVRKAHYKRADTRFGWLVRPGAVFMLGAILFTCAALAEEKPVTLKLESKAFTEGGAIPKKYTCEGEDISPPLSWTGMPQGAKSLALIVDDPDAPDPKAPKMTWVHWVLYSIPPETTGLAEGIAPNALPHGTMSGLNDWKRTGYGGPCPPIGRHRYFFKLYALDTALSGLKQPNKAAVEAAMANHILAQATLMGTYEKGR
jgi:Raf kinase inhibitor-like YbhB/YbcL family protein